MRILADENVHGAVVQALRDAGHDVRWVLEDDPGLDDVAVLARAQASGRVLITFDKGDFGKLIFQQRHPAPGVVLFRIGAESPAELVDAVLRILNHPRQWIGRFWTVSNTSIRTRVLP